MPEHLVGSVLQFQPDTRYTEGVFAATQGDPRTLIRLPFLGWAVEIEWHEEQEAFSVVAPVFLHEEDAVALTRTAVESTLHCRLIRLVPVEPTGGRR